MHFNNYGVVQYTFDVENVFLFLLFSTTNNLFSYCDQNFMSRVKQRVKKRVLFSTSKVAVPVSVIEMIFGRRKVKMLTLEI